MDPLFTPKLPEFPVISGAVTYEPGARSYWLIHQAGQYLLVTSGVGLTGTWDGKVDVINTGDVTWCPPGVKHWHGATPTTATTHIAITGTLQDGSNVAWMEEVTDEQYKGGIVKK